MRNNICFHVEPNRVVVTWNNVGYFSSHDDRQNDFQLVLTTSNTCTTTGDFDVEFRYNRCQWTTGDASGGTGGLGGTPAQVGFDAGNRRNYVALPMSRTMAILDVCRTSPTCPAAPPASGASRSAAATWRAAAWAAGRPAPSRARWARAGRASTSARRMGVRCAQVNMPRDERCNGNDDNCNGTIDEGDNLCPTNYVCDRGSCVERCSQELGCPAGQTCTSDGHLRRERLHGPSPAPRASAACRATAWASATASVPGRPGVPRGPLPQPLRGRPLQPDGGVRPQPRPDGGPLRPGLPVHPLRGGSDVPARRLLRDRTTAPASPARRAMYCRGGQCRDACETGPDTRLCPSGEVCTMGECVPQAMAPRPDAGVADGGNPDAGAPTAGCPPST
jgi:hypothetical protein